MEQTEKPIRVRNAGEELRQRPVQPSNELDHCPRTANTREARILSAGAAGAVFAQSFRTPLRGQGTRNDRHALGPDETRGDDARLDL